jgi:hypothetical protein
MTIDDVKPFEGKRISVKSRKLNKAVSGELRAIFAGALIIYAEYGIFGIFPQDVVEIEEVLI